MLYHLLDTHAALLILLCIPLALAKFLSDVPLVGDILDPVFGWSAQDNANKALGLTGDQVDLMREQQQWERQMFSKYGEPALRQQLSDQAANAGARTQMRDMLRGHMGSDQMRWLSVPDEPIAMPLTPDWRNPLGGARPDFMNVPRGDLALASVPESPLALQDAPDWRNPLTPEQEAAFRRLDMETRSAAGRDAKASITADLSRKGLRADGGTASMNASAGLRNAMDRQRALDESKLTMFKLDRGDTLRAEANQTALTRDQIETARREEANRNALIQEDVGRARRGEERQNFWDETNRGDTLRNEALQKELLNEDINRSRRDELRGNFWNLYGAATGEGTPSQLTSYSPMFSGWNAGNANAAQIYNSQAQMFNSQAQGILGDLGSLAGYWMGGGFKRP